MYAIRQVKLKKRPYWGRISRVMMSWPITTLLGDQATGDVQRINEMNQFFKRYPCTDYARFASYRWLRIFNSTLMRVTLSASLLSWTCRKLVPNSKLA